MIPTLESELEIPSISNIETTIFYPVRPTGSLSKFKHIVSDTTHQTCSCYTIKYAP